MTFRQTTWLVLLAFIVFPGRALAQPVSLSLQGNSCSEFAALKTQDEVAFFSRQCSLNGPVPNALCLLEHLRRLTFDGQAVSSLPPCFENLKFSLEVLLFFGSSFSEIPSVLGEFHKLRMLSFKGSQVSTIHPTSLSPSIQWLILTGNRFGSLPSSIGALSLLKKLMLASNNMTMLPASLCRCQQLELIRLANNNLRMLPACIAFMPQLAWIALAANPVALPSIAPKELEIDFNMEQVREWRELGSGASGRVYAGTHAGSPAAVKIFKATSSDGRAEDEVSITALASSVPGCMGVRAFFRAPQWGMVMEFLDGFVPLARPPTFETITRDVYDVRTQLSFAGLMAVLSAVARACQQLHDTLQIMHGDLYGHNIMVRKSLRSGSSAVSVADVRLTDFGAGFRYNRTLHNFQPMEVRAFGILLSELLSHSVLDDHEEARKALMDMCRRCLRIVPSTRPRFAEIEAELASLWSATPAAA